MWASLIVLLIQKAIYAVGLTFSKDWLDGPHFSVVYIDGSQGVCSKEDCGLF